MKKTSTFLKICFILKGRVKRARAGNPKTNTLQCLWAVGWYSADLSLRFCSGCYIYCCAHAEQVPKVCNTNDTRNTDTQTRARACWPKNISIEQPEEKGHNSYTQATTHLWCNCFSPSSKVIQALPTDSPCYCLSLQALRVIQVTERGSGLWIKLNL